MKIKRLFIALVCAAFVHSNASAHGDENSEKQTSFFSVYQQIGRKLKSPAFSLQLMGSKEIVVHFHIKSDFSVKVEEARGTDQRLCNYVKKELEKQKIYTDKQQVGKSYSVKLRFE